MNMIKVGDKIRIKDNLFSELGRIGFDTEEALMFSNKWAGITCLALHIWTDDNEGERYITVALCCEIPIAACELVIEEASSDESYMYSTCHFG